MNDRADVLRSLVRWDRPLPEIAEALRRLPWDSDEALVTLRPRDVSNALNRYVGGELTPSDVEAWANAIESREDIGIEDEGLVGRAIFELANPSLSGRSTLDHAREWIGRLAAATIPAGGS